MSQRAIRKLRQPTQPLVLRVLRSAAAGIAAGFVVAAICLAIGLLRAALVLLQGQRLKPISSADLYFVARYAIGFGLGGLVVGACWPWIRHRVVRHIAFYVAGFLTATTLAGAEHDLFGDNRAFALPMLIMLGIVFGPFGVYYFEHNYPKQAGVPPGLPD